MNRLCISAALVASVAGMATQATAQQYTVQLTSTPNTSTLFNIGDSTTVNTSALLVGGVGPSDLSILAFHLEVLSGNASISNLLGLGAFTLLPPPNPGDVVLFANPAVAGPGPLLSSSHLITRTGPGDILVGFSAVQGVPVQGSNCATTFTGGGYTIVPAPGAAAVLGLGGLLAARRRR